MAFDLPRNVIVPVDEVDVSLDPAPHPFEVANRDLIESNWTAEKAANPAVFDGRVVLLSELAYADRRLVGRCHEIRFATFMLWRKTGAVSNAEHAYAHAVLVSRDNALVAVRMGGHTVNAGRVYFAAGTFEPIDFPNGKVDLHVNMAREVMEETGIDLALLRRGRAFHALSMTQGTVIFRRYHHPEAADTIVGRIREFVAKEAEPEISAPVVIRNMRDLPDGLMPHMRPLIDWHFSTD